TQQATMSQAKPPHCPAGVDILNRPQPQRAVAIAVAHRIDPQWSEVAEISRRLSNLLGDLHRLAPEGDLIGTQRKIRHFQRTAAILRPHHALDVDATVPADRQLDSRFRVGDEPGLDEQRASSAQSRNRPCPQLLDADLLMQIYAK